MLRVLALTNIFTSNLFNKKHLGKTSALLNFFASVGDKWIAHFLLKQCYDLQQ